MNRHYMAIAVLTAAFVVFPAFTFAQHGGGMHGGMMHSGMGSPIQDQQQIVGQGMAHNMAMMSGKLHDMHQMMIGGQMTQEQHGQMMEMIRRMGCMMEEMAGPHGAHLDQQHTHELHEMRSRLDSMKAGLHGQSKKPGPSQE